MESADGPGRSSSDGSALAGSKASMSLKKQVASGVMWTGTSTGVTTGLQFLQLAVLAHLLNPGDFGLMAMIMVVVGFAQAFTDMGLSSAIVHRQDMSRQQLSSLYWVNIVGGLLVFGLVMACTPAIVIFYREPRLIGLMPWVALIFLVSPLGQQFQMLLQKELQFYELTKVDMISTVIGTVIAIASAMNGSGVFSLVWGQLAESSVRAVLLARLGWRNWRPRIHFSWNDLKGCTAFGVFQMAERTLNYFSANVDYLVIGRFLGPHALGIYMLAYQLVTRPLAKINPILTRVAFPVFAKRQTDNSALCRGYLEMIKLLAFLVLPLLFGLAATAPVVVPVFFGPEWHAAVSLIQILALLGVFKALVNPLGSILLAKGRADIGFKCNALTAILNASVFWFVVLHGVYAVAWSYVGLSFAYFIMWWKILHRIINLHHRDHAAVLIPSLVMSILMGATVYVGYMVLSPLVGNNLILLICLVTFGISVYSLGSVLWSDYFRELWVLVKMQRGMA